MNAKLHKEIHIHTYERLPGKSPKGRIYFRCIEPLCYHKIDTGMILGKACRCVKCDGIFILSANDLKRKNPRCIDCSETNEAKEKRARANMLGNMLGEAGINVELNKEHDLKGLLR